MKVVIASDIAAEREHARAAAVSLGLDAVAIRVSDLASRTAIEKPDLVVVAVGLDERAALSAVFAAGDVPAYLLLRDNTDFLPNLLRAGARGYLRSDNLTDDLASAVDELIHAAPLQVAFGKVIGISGGVAGVGVTTVATQLAFALAEVHPGRVALVQLDAAVADLSVTLGLAPSYRLAEIAAGWDHLAPAVLARRMVEHPAGVNVLADIAGAEMLQWTPEALRQLLGVLRSRFEFVVVDFGHAVDPARLEALKFADGIAVVLRLDAPAIALGRQLVSRLIDGGVRREKLVGVVNRIGQPGQLPWADANAALTIDFADPLPDDPDRMNQTINARRPLVTTAANAPITAGFARLADRWTTRRSHAPRQVVAGAG